MEELSSNLKSKILQKLMDTSNNVVLILSSDMRIIQFNEVANRLFDHKLTFNQEIREICELNSVEPVMTQSTIRFVLTESTGKDKTDTGTLIKKLNAIEWEVERFGGDQFYLIIGSNHLTIRELERQSHLLKTYFESIIAHLPGHIFWKDRNCVYLGCNDKMARICGLNNRDEIIGKTDRDLVWGSQLAEEFIRDDKFVMDTENPKFNVIEHHSYLNNDDQVMLTNKVPLKDKAGNIIGVLGMAVDITEQKQVEEALKREKQKSEAASQSKSEFIANMNHDLRTAITGMLGMIQDLMNTAEHAESSLRVGGDSSDSSQASKAPQVLKHLIDTVQRDGQFLMGATDELLQLCNEILEIIRLESGQADQRVESFSLTELVEHNVELLQPVARHKKLQLTYEVDGRLPRYLKGLRIYLDRVLLNLLSNALKFTETGSVNVSATAVLNEKHGADYSLEDPVTLQIAVRDTGIGIPKDKFEVIFEHFSRLTPAYEGIYKGAGLGLYTVKRYVEALQGTIRVDSEVGQGACFTVTLPFVVSDRTDRVKQSVRFPKTSQWALGSPAPFSGNGPQETLSAHEARATVLIVEDQPLAACSAELALKHFRCRSETAQRGAQAIKMAQTGHYDLILMDIGLPDLSGIEVTRKIRAFDDPVKSKVPIVALTGHAHNPDMRQEALNAGMQEVLSKPAQPLALESVLKTYVFKTETQEEQASAPQGAAPTTPSALDFESLAVIDWKECVRLCAGDPEFARSMLRLLVDDLKKTQAVLEVAYANRDTLALRAELHRARGGACYLKVPQLEHTLKAFHQAVKAVPQDNETLELTYAALQQAMRSFWQAWESTGF